MYIEVFIFYVSYSQNSPSLLHCFLFILTGLASNEKTAYHFYSNANVVSRSGSCNFLQGHVTSLPSTYTSKLKKKKRQLFSKDNHLNKR